MSNQIAHDLNSKWRSDDVMTNEQNNFSSFNLDERILAGLTKAGYRIPSPVQMEAIPLCLTGCDVFVQGKAGTGKTLVFSILALTKILEAEDMQVLIVAPTREGAYQIFTTINAIGYMVKDLKCECFIGGFSFVDDMSKAEKCRIAVGTPGRIFHLIRENKLHTDAIGLFVIDDVDELLNKHVRPEVTEIFDSLPGEMQIVVTSLTCTDEVVQLASEYLKDSSLAYYCDSELPLSLGMAHYYHVVPLNFLNSLVYRKKLAVLKEIFLKVKFSQCVIFCNSIAKVELLYADVKNCGLSVLSMTKAMDQMERIKVLEELKRNKCKVFIATDVGSRGLDAENVDLVINFDFPGDSRSYLHRCGRAGRYGAKCSSITFLRECQKEFFFELENEIQFESCALPDPIPEDLNCDLNSSEVRSVPYPIPEDLNCDLNSSEVRSVPCKSSGSESSTGENRISSLLELSKNAVANLEKSKAEENCSLLTANETKEQAVKLEIADINHPMQDLTIGQPENGLDEDGQDSEKIKAPQNSLLLFDERNEEIPGNAEPFCANQLSRDIEHIEAFNREQEIKNPEDISLKAVHAPFKKVTWECTKGSVLSFSDLKNTIEKSSESKIKAEKHLKKFYTRGEYAYEEDLLPSTIVPKNKFKIKSTSKTTKDVSHRPFHEAQLEKEIPHRKFSKISHKNHKKKTFDGSFGYVHSNMPPSLAHETQVMYNGLKTTSESNLGHCYKNIFPKRPVNHSCKKTACMKHNMHSKCKKCLDGYGDHSHTYFNGQGNPFQSRSCCFSIPDHSSSQCCSFPNPNYQHQFQMHRDMFYKQWKFVNDFSHFLSHIHASLP